MGDQLIASVVTVATAIVGVAIIAVLVSQKANTSGVISAAGNAFANDLSVAVSPVTGSSSGLGFGNSFTGGGVGQMNEY
jgi:hypothetical protein